MVREGAFRSKSGYRLAERECPGEIRAHELDFTREGERNQSCGGAIRSR
jgi:hypothetical protein